MRSEFQYRQIAAENIAAVRAAALKRPAQHPRPPDNDLEQLYVYHDGTADIVPPHTTLTPDVQTFAPVYNYKYLLRLSRRLKNNERGG
jgi:hypothetical protein